MKKSLRTQDINAARTLASSLSQKIQMTFALIRSGTLPEDQIDRLLADFLPRKRQRQIKPSLSKIIKLFIEERSTRWRSKTLLEFKSIFALIQKILGDKDLDSYVRADFVGCRDKLLQIPTNCLRSEKLRELSVEEILKRDWSRTLSPKTVNKYLALLSTLIKWSAMQGFVSINLAEGLSLPVDEKPEESRKVYSPADLMKIVQILPSPEIKPERYWVPLIAMYSGLRLDEICQLHISDLRLVDDVWCFDINNCGAKKLKTVSSRRVIPIHPQLIKMGLWAIMRVERGERMSLCGRG